MKLRRLADSFHRLLSASEERAVTELAVGLGPSAVSTCVRELGHAEERRWRKAYRLLAEIGRESGRARVSEGMSSLLTDANTSDEIKIRAIAVVAELNLELPPAASLKDPDRARLASVADLAACLRSREDMARAVDHLLDSLAGEEIIGFVDDIVKVTPPVAAALVDEILVRDDLPTELRRQFRVLRASLPADREPVDRAELSAVRAMIGHHRDGRRMALAWARVLRQQKEPAYRAMCAIINSQDLLEDAHYRDSMDSRTIDREFLSPLREQGFLFRRVTVDVARRLLGHAARRRAQSGRAQPRAFYIGRDLFGLMDQHLPAARRLDRELDLAALLGRALELCAGGDYREARPLLEGYLVELPLDGEARAALGVTLLHLGDATGAEVEFRQAVDRQPDNPIYLWNLASAAHQSGHGDVCYTALQRYLVVGDLEDATSEREQMARDLIAEYERLGGCAADTIAFKSTE